MLSLLLSIVQQNSACMLHKLGNVLRSYSGPVGLLSIQLCFHSELSVCMCVWVLDAIVVSSVLWLSATFDIFKKTLLEHPDTLGAWPMERSLKPQMYQYTLI